MLTELYGKGGQVCQLAKIGQIKCPLIVRPTSEDVITGHLFQSLRVLNPRWWLPQLLNTALGTERFRQQVYRRLKIDLWKNRRSYPRELLPWTEGSTQVDVTITWENPPTTVFFELKYGSDIGARTEQNSGQHGYPADQLIRNVRVGLLECGWFRRERLFDGRTRDFAMILVGPKTGHALVQRYREPDQLRRAIPHGQRLTRLPQQPFLGEVSFPRIVALLRRQRRWFDRAERQVIDDVTGYLEFKHARTPSAAPGGRVERARSLLD